MTTHSAQTKLTLAKATLLEPDQLEGISARDLILTDKERKATSNLWVYLTGVEVGTRLEVIAGNEVLGDGELTVRLNMPARAFVDWFRREDWGCFALSEETDSDVWAWTALERARAMCAAMGTLVLQVPLRLPVGA